METISEVNRHYQDEHRAESKGWEFMKEVGLVDECSAEFGLGYAARNLGSALADRQTKQGKTQRLELKQCGVLREEDSKPVLYGITVPFMDGNGEVIDIYSYNFDAQKDAPKELYLEQNRKGLIHVGDREAKELVLVESPMDALALYSIGKKTGAKLLCNVVCAGDLAAVRSVLSATSKIYTTYTLPTALAEAIEALDCEVLHVHRDTLTGSFLDQLKQGNAGVEAVLRVFASPSCVAAGSTVEPEPEAEVEFHEARGHYTVAFASRTYRVVGLQKNKGYDAFKIRLTVWNQDPDPLVHDDRLDLCSQKNRLRFAKDAAEALAVNPAEMKKEMGKLLAQVEMIQEDRLTTPKGDQSVELCGEDRAVAEAFLRSPDLWEQLTSHLELTGCEGEDGLAAYLSGVSRLMEKPLAAMCQHPQLAQSVLTLFPEEAIHNHTDISEKALYYEGETKLKNKVLCVESVRKGGAITQLLKQGRISQLTTIKDKETGGMVAVDYVLECRPMVFLAESNDAELKELCLPLKGGIASATTMPTFSIESLVQEEKRKQTAKLHQNAQRLLKPWRVVNPFADKLEFPTNNQQAFLQYLQLIEAVTLLHQLQRERKTYKHGSELIEYIETTAEDVQRATALARHVFRRSSVDELPPTLRKTFSTLAEYVMKKRGNWREIEFTRSDILSLKSHKRTTLGKHIKRLTNFDFLQQVKGENGVEMSYRLLVDPSTLQGEILPFADQSTCVA